MTRRLPLIVAMTATLSLFGCGQQSTPPAVSQVAAPVVDAAAQLDAIYADFWESWLRLNPLAATQQGDHRFNDQLPNTLTTEYREKLRALHQGALDAARAVDASALKGQASLSHQVFLQAREGDLAMLAFPRHLLPMNQFYNFANQFVVLGAGANAQPFLTVVDYDNWLSRAQQMPAFFDQAIANMREGMASGVVQPKVLMERVLPQLDKQLVDNPEESLFFQPIKAMPQDFPEADQARLSAAYRSLISGSLLPAYTKLRDFVRDEYLPACRDTAGLGALPNGEAWYAQLVRDNTTTDLTPEQIHQIGLDEVARIHAEMRGVMAQLKFDGDLQAFFKHVQTLPSEQFESEAALLKAYRGFRAEVEPRLANLFDLRPKGDFEIRPVEAFRAASSSSGSYQSAPEDLSRPGIFYVNTYDLKARPVRALESLYLHEATPGHHFQIALQRESQALPRFRRFGGETAFSEGWGLYSESLGKELGVYQDPMMYFGALEADLWRSIRLVVDTGLHAKGWSRQEVLDYMYANSASEPTRAISEAERFMAIPGQALAYKIGQLKIRELRTRAETALGERFDVKAFHNEVLRDGAVPLGVLEAKIDRWIATVGAV